MTVSPSAPSSYVPFSLFHQPRFAPVAAAFQDNFKNGLELGASFTVYQGGEKLIEFFGGWADKNKGRAVDSDTLFSVYSSGKAVASLVMAHLAEEDRFGYDQPIRSIWPEFDTHGKGDLTIAEILSHQSGLSGITNSAWTPIDWYDWDKSCAELAAQMPIFPPGSASGYGPITYGFLAGEIARRSDKFGRTLGQILREDIAAPHELNIWIGLPEAEHHRCAYMQKPRSMADLGEINMATRAAFLEKWSNPGGKDITAWREAEFAGSNCQASADSLARLMQMALTGFVGSEKFLSEDIISQLHKLRVSGPDQILPFSLDFAAGIMRNTPNFFYGPNANTLGHSGWGGSCVFADPDTKISGAYTMNQQDNSLIGDPRPVGLIKALYDCLK